MTNSNRLLLTAVLLLACGLLLLFILLVPGLARMIAARRTPTPDVVGTFRALVATGSPSAPSATPSGPLTFPPVIETLFPATSVPSASVPSASAAGSPGGHIVFTCQIFKYQSSEQICMVNPDGTNYHRLTTEDGFRHFYPSLAPDGKSVVYSQYREDNVYELYELKLSGGAPTRLTDRSGTLTAPEISPDGKSIVYMRWTVASDQDQVWVMDRDGSNAHRAFKNITAWDPTWSPDGKQILFASDKDGSDQLYIGNANGSGIHKISTLPSLRGRSDWSPQNLIATYSGDAWAREIYVMKPDGSDTHQVSPKGGNSQGPSFSPDGQWIAFTAYYDHFNDINGCEIYIMRLDGSDLRRLTNNGYCDYQPRWGP